MGAYAEVEDVLRYLDTVNVVFDETEKVTEADVEAFISQIESEINGILRAQGYEEVPATGTHDVPMLTRFTAEKVAAMVSMIIFVSEELPERVKVWNGDYKEFLNRLRQGQQYLVDQAPESDEVGSFLIVRHPTRDRYFTERYNQSDWDE